MDSIGPNCRRHALTTSHSKDDNSNEMNEKQSRYSVHISGQLSSQATAQAICGNQLTQYLVKFYKFFKIIFAALRPNSSSCAGTIYCMRFRAIHAHTYSEITNASYATLALAPCAPFKNADESESR